MNRMSKSLFALALCTIAVDSIACSCAKVSAHQRYSDASDVFLGKIIETKLVTKTQRFGDQEISSDSVSAVISVTRSLKGKHSGTRQVSDSVADGANCGIGLLTGREYLFYLFGNETVSICGGSKLYNEFSDKDLIEDMLSY